MLIKKNVGWSTATVWGLTFGTTLLLCAVAGGMFIGGCSKDAIGIAVTLAGALLGGACSGLLVQMLNHIEVVIEPKPQAAHAIASLIAGIGIFSAAFTLALAMSIILIASLRLIRPSRSMHRRESVFSRYIPHRLAFG